MKAIGRISGRRVLGLDDHALEQVDESVGCLGVECVIVCLQGAGWGGRMEMDSGSCTGAI